MSNLTLVPNLQQEGKDIVNVKNNGAKGDGVTDDTAAINSVIAASSGKIVYFPEGTYNISSLATLANNTHLKGDGIDKTIIFKDSGTTSTMIDFGITNTGYLEVEDMTLDGNSNLSDQSPLTIGKLPTYVRVERIKIIDPSNTRVALRGNLSGGAKNIFINDCMFQDCLYGAISNSPADKGIDNVNITNNTIVGCGGSILQLGANLPRWHTYTNVTIKGNKIISCADAGTYGAIPMEIWGCTNETITDNLIDSGTRGLSGGLACANVNISNNVIKNQQTYGVEASSSRNVRIANNVFENCNKGIEIDPPANSIHSIGNLVIEGNTFEGSGAGAYAEGGNPTYAIRSLTEQTVDVKIINNVFKNRKFDQVSCDIRGCSAIPTLTFGGGGTGAEGTVTLKVVDVLITNEGTDYTSAPTITVNDIDGNGSGAVITATVSNGKLVEGGFTISNAGSGYTSVPTATLSGGKTDETTTQGDIELIMGIDAIAITAGGSGYTSPTLTITKDSGFGATATCSEAGGVIQDTVVITAAGSHYGIGSSLFLQGNLFETTEHNTPYYCLNAGCHKNIIKGNTFYRSTEYDRTSTYYLSLAMINLSSGLYSDPKPVCIVEDNDFIMDGTTGSGTFQYAIQSAGDVYGRVIRNNRFRGNFKNVIINHTGLAGDTLIYDNDFTEVNFDGTLVPYGAGTTANLLTHEPTAILVISLDGVIHTTPYAISGVQNGFYFDNTGATALGQFDLPAAVKGMEFTFERVATQTLQVDPNGTEYFADVGTHGYKSLDSDGAYMQIKCFKDGVWHVVASLGVISDE